MSETTDEKRIEAAMNAWFEISENYRQLLKPGERLFHPNRYAVRKMLEAADAVAKEERAE